MNINSRDSKTSLTSILLTGPDQLPRFAAARFFDIDRVEVLRGPQGTIYGSGSMGGTLHFVSRAPQLDKFEGSFNSSLSSTEGGAMNGEMDGVVNIPLVDGQAALRIGGLVDHESGWIDRNDAGTIVADKINHVNTSVLRATLEWHPVDRLTVTPAAFLQRVSVGGQDLFSLDLPLYESPTLIPEVGRDQYAMNSLTIKYDFGWSDLTSVSGYFWRRDNRNIDGTFYDSVYLGQFLQQTYGYGGDAIGALAAPVQFNTNVNQIHEELRLSSKTKPDDAWSWIGGLFYSRSRTGLLDNEYIPGFNSTFEATYNNTPLNLLGAAFPNDLVYYAFTEFVNTQKAVFGQVNYQPLPGLKVTVGGRYEKSTEDLSFNSLGFFSSGEPFSGSASGSKFTPRVALSYEAGKSTFYVSASEGFRDGGINRPVPVPLCSGDLAQLGFKNSPPSYSADSLWSYELGTKSRVGDSVSLSAALFDIRWNNIQTDILLPTCTFDIKANIGSAESRGLEFELNARIIDQLQWSLSGNYTSAKITVPVTVLGVQRGDWVARCARLLRFNERRLQSADQQRGEGRRRPECAVGRHQPGHHLPRGSGLRPAGVRGRRRQGRRPVAAAGCVAVRHQLAQQRQDNPAAQHRGGGIWHAGAAADDRAECGVPILTISIATRAAPGDEVTLFRLAAQLEQAKPWGPALRSFGEHNDALGHSDHHSSPRRALLGGGCIAETLHFCRR